MNTRRTRPSVLAVPLITAVILLVSAAIAFAAPPAAGPITVKTIGFENAGDTMAPTSVAGALGEPATKAYWGRVTGAKRTGAYGFWCAGTGAPFGVYPEPTRGIAWAELPELADYYSATYSLWYVMPSRGSNDAYAFRIGWQDPGLGQSYYYNQFARSSTWVSRSFDLSDPGNSVSLSRRAGRINVQFHDEYWPDTNGRGPTIDDIVVAGYKYGAVDDLSATSTVPGQIALSWTPPDASTGSTADDTRTIGYRVWRTLAHNDTWTELTSETSRVVGSAFTDHAVAPGASYTYAVQAWDPDSGLGHGAQMAASEYASAIVLGAVLTTAALTPPSVPSLARTWAAFTTTGTLDPAHAIGSAAVEIQCSRDRSVVQYSYDATMQADGVTYQGAVALPSSGSWYVRARHYDDGHLESFSEWRAVTVSARVVLSKPSRPSGSRVNKTYTVKGTVEPVHRLGKYVRVYAYRYSNGKRVQTLVFTPTLSTSGMPFGTARYTAKIKLTKRGTWKLRAKHLGHGLEGETYSDYTSSFKIK